MANHPLLLGHRGVRAEKSIPENSLPSFDLALAQGCDGFEFDVRLSADGQAVICH
ncbi:MAG: glycerophosphoryl diester phosphodiesterase, partial [Candidatus Sulfotelmatobacter sp.]|nr:glycerophosphoryl diester phosphodiesterase [Candidatus Sulfotelmatobacter sp.]